MTDQQAHIQFIIEHPEDDLARLVYADFLEDQGQAEQAEFIRVQIELAKWPDENFCPVCTKRTIWTKGKEGVPYLAQCQEGHQWIFADHQKLKQREKELRIHCQDWLPIPGYIWYEKGSAFCIGGSQEMPMNAKPHYSVEFRRGLAEQIADISLEDWIDNGEKICQHHPIQEVVISNKKPLGGYVWRLESPFDMASQTFVLPKVIYNCLSFGHNETRYESKRYTSKEGITADQIAMKDLSQACIRLFRDKKSTSLA